MGVDIDLKLILNTNKLVLIDNFSYFVQIVVILVAEIIINFDIHGVRWLLIVNFGGIDILNLENILLECLLFLRFFLQFVFSLYTNLLLFSVRCHQKKLLDITVTTWFQYFGRMGFLFCILLNQKTSFFTLWSKMPLLNLLRVFPFLSMLDLPISCKKIKTASYRLVWTLWRDL